MSIFKSLRRAFSRVIQVAKPFAPLALPFLGPTGIAVAAMINAAKQNAPPPLEELLRPPPPPTAVPFFPEVFTGASIGSILGPWGTVGGAIAGGVGSLVFGPEDEEEDDYEDDDYEDEEDY